MNDFSTEPRIALPGSHRTSLSATVLAPPDDPLTVSVILTRQQPLAPASLGQTRLTRAQYLDRHAADPAHVDLLRNFAAAYGLAIVEDPSSLARRTVQITGTVANMQQAFGVTLMQHTEQGLSCRVREGSIHLPESLASRVVAVLGLDNRPQAKPHFRVAHTVNTSFTPVQLAGLYQFPPSPNASGQTIGIIELGGGFRDADITSYFQSLNLVVPNVTAVSVDGGTNAPTTPSGADGEVMLDIEVSGAVAPGANLAVYFAPNTDQGFIDAISTAVHDTANHPSVISISWGGPESSWTQQAVTALDQACQSAAALGITITVACGDNGSTDGVSDGANHVDFPASSPHVLACGGTKITANGSVISSETVWNELASNEGATGGGVSNLFPLPTWQATAKVPAPTSSTGGRGLPDVAADADPATGYQVLVDGQQMVIGGTSAVAPLYAGLIAVANALNAKSAGFLNPILYQNPAAFRDITSGNNGAFKAGPGWDACTGLGSPLATRIIIALKAAGA